MKDINKMIVKQGLNKVEIEIQNITIQVKGTYKNQAYRAEYDQYYQWNTGYGIQAVDANFEHSDEYEQWITELTELLNNIDARTLL